MCQGGKAKRHLSENFSTCSNSRVATQLPDLFNSQAAQSWFWSFSEVLISTPRQPNLHMKRPKSPVLVKIHRGGDILLLLSAGALSDSIYIAVASKSARERDDSRTKHTQHGAQQGCSRFSCVLSQRARRSLLLQEFFSLVKIQDSLHTAARP